MPTDPPLSVRYEDNGESHDAGDDGPVVIDPETAEALYLDACRKAAKAGL